VPTTQLKRDVKVGRAPVARYVEKPPSELATMKVFDLLLAAPKVGRVKAMKMLSAIRVSPSKTVGGLTDRQRSELLSLLHRR
jgi:hypothetical protein